jgi:putative N6-adenine-specific DNA methylase
VSALEKRIKRHILGTPQEAVIRFPKGFGDVCLTEVKEFVERAELEDNGIRLTEVAYRDLATLPLMLTTAREILWTVGKGKAETIKQIKARVEEVAFDLIFPAKTALSLRVNSTASRLFHEGKVAELVEGELRAKGLRVKKDANHLLDVRLFEDYLTLRLSLSGRPLHHRGYKTELKGTASVKEDVAAAAIRASLGDFTPDHVWVPFAGSGTLGFETILALGHVPPAAFGNPMSQDTWLCTPEATLAHAKKKRLEAARKAPPVTFVEVDEEQAKHLKKNVDRFTNYADVTVETADALKSPRTPAGQRLFVPLNPPYGERLGKKHDAPTLYRDVARRLNDVRAELKGFVFAPTEAVADAFCSAFRGDTSRRAFNHGGRNTYMVTFDRQ